MPYYRRVTPAIERSPPIPDSARSIVCFSCGDSMKHLRTIPKLGVRKQKLIFVCPSCNEVVTRELIGAQHEAAAKVPDHASLQNA